MALQGSGAISLSQIAAEFGGTAPHSMSEYYGGGGNVPAGANPNVATSGAHNMKSFYNGVAATVLNITSSTSNYSIASAAQSAGGDLNTPVILTINSGVSVTTMTTGTGWGSGTTINIINNGTVIGVSGSNTTSTGSGGAGGGSGVGVAGSAGISGTSGSSSTNSSNNGGDAFTHSQGGSNLSVIFDTVGTRTAGAAGTKTYVGGGGGGGGGGGYQSFFRPTAGGGGGGGAPYGVGGGGGGTGGTATATTGGAGATGGSNSGRGGNGGNPGSAGGHGATGPAPNGHSKVGGAGGAAGASGTVNGTAGSALGGNTGQIS